MAMDDLIPGLPEEGARDCLVRIGHDLLSTAGSVCRSWKEELSSPLFRRIRKSKKHSQHVVVFVQPEPSIVATEGPARKYSTPRYRLLLLDPSAATWRALPPVPCLPSGLPIFCQLAAVGTQLVVLGGWDPDTWAPTDGVYVYDFLTDNWRRGARMPGPRRSLFASAGGGSKVFVAGGHDAEKNALRSALAYDVAADEWAPLPDMAIERDECKGAFFGGRFRVIGGYSTERQGRFGKSSEAFDVATWKWCRVEEDTLEDATCPRTCIADEEGGELYAVRRGHVAVAAGGKCRELAEVPEDAAVAPQLVTWKGKLLLTGSGSHGGPLIGYLLEMAGSGEGKNRMTWQRMAVPEEYSGHIQSACCLEI